MKHAELTRTREKGTRVTSPVSGEERIMALRSIVDTNTYSKIDGCMIDLFSASAIIKVYDALNPVNQEKYRRFPAPKMAEIAFSLIT